MCGNILSESLARHIKKRREFLVYLLQRFNIIVGFFQRMLLGKFSLCKSLGEDLLELWYEHGKDLVWVGDGQSLLEEVKQRVEGMRGRVEIFCLLPFQISYFFEVGLEDSEVGLLARFPPGDRRFDGSFL